MDNILICKCNNVSKQEITNAICKNNYSSIGEIQKTLQAGTICGRCIPEIRGLLSSENK